MAERERFRLDGRAVALGVRRAVLTAGVVWPVLYGLTLVWRPVLRDFGGSGYAPGPVALGVVAAFVGFIGGWAKMRGSRRVVATGATVARPAGARALDLARVDRDARRSAGRGEGLAKPLRVQRWSADLLDGGDLPADSDGQGVSPHGVSA